MIPLGLSSASLSQNLPELVPSPNIPAGLMQKDFDHPGIFTTHNPSSVTLKAIISVPFLPTPSLTQPMRRILDVSSPTLSSDGSFNPFLLVHVSVSGGVFNVQANLDDSNESDFRRVRLGDLKLLKEVATQAIVKYQDIPHKKTGVVKRRVPQVVGVRRIHQARVIGMQENFTAVVYEEQREEFRQTSFPDSIIRCNFKHPSQGLIYNDGLIPLDEFRQMHKQSPLVSAFVEHEIALFLTGTMLWIRVSTGQLCIEVNDNEEQDISRLPIRRKHGSIPGVHFTSDINLEEEILSNMSLDDIHQIFCYWWNQIEISDPGTILLGSLSWPTTSCAHQFNPFSEISLSDSLGLLDVHVENWEYFQVDSSFPNEGLVTLLNGWTRYNSPLFNL
ncbi:hypothetical protein C8J57DRAFT_1227687 [Mycena rebaudengoi]|nr:hypothetical protein C8J57DRAFT_1227687 [Mycena rebaudengoi]